MRILALMYVLLLTGCSPRLSPLYRDYEVTARAPIGADNERAATLDTIRGALVDAGWTPRDGVTGNVVATESRPFRQWGVYAIEVELEVAPVGGEYVRLLVHPYRIYFNGAKRKIPYLRASLARPVLKDLHASMEERGLKHIGTAQTRDGQVLRRN
jgi:hypothetical protein